MDGSVKRAPATPRRRAQGRAKFPLAFRFFIATALVIALVVAIAVGATIRRSHQVARATVDKAIANAGTLFKDVERDRLRLLSLGAISLARNPNFASYIQASVSAGRIRQSRIFTSASKG